jgi:hypothetical protein
VLDLFPRRGGAASDVPHHLRIAIEVVQLVHVVMGKPAEKEPFSLEEDVQPGSPDTDR